jgi:hypothetical protein
MDRDLVWHDLAPDYGVLEVHERLTDPGAALELHIVLNPDAGTTVAWWVDEWGTCLGEARVGRG